LTGRQIILCWSATRKAIKGTCLQARSATGFSAILLCCELCQAVQVYKRYRDQLRLYRQGFDFTEYTAFSNYTTDRPEIAVGLRYEIYRKPDNETSIVFWNICALVSFDACVREDSTLLQHGWHELDEACWLVKGNIQVLYMHKTSLWWMLGKMFQRKEIHNKLQLTECSWMNKNEITRNTGEIFPILVNGSSIKQILESNSLSSSSWSTLHYTKCVRRIAIYIL